MNGNGAKKADSGTRFPWRQTESICRPMWFEILSTQRKVVRPEEGKI